MSRYKGSLQLYYARADAAADELISRESPEYLITVDPDEYLDHLVAKFEFEPLVILWDEETVEQFKVRRTRPARSWDLERSGTVTEDVEMLRIRIPLAPNPDRVNYFSMEGSKGYLGHREPDWRFEGDVLVMEVEATEQAVTELRRDLKHYTDGRNEDIAKGNPTLRDRVGPVLRARRKQLEENVAKSKSTIEKLGLRLYVKPGAPKPVTVTPRRLAIPKPKAKPHDPEPTLGDETVGALVQHLVAHGRQLETAPDSYASLPEETLRNIILGSLNAGFSVTGEASATAETFSKLGKTDIQLKVDGLVPLVIECKFWDGSKAYLEAIAQLFDYVTWRHGHAVLLHFSKTQDLTATIHAAMEVIAADATTIGEVVQKSDSSFVSRHKHPQDEGKTVEVHHLFFDLSLSPNRTRARGQPTGDKRD